MTKQEFIEEVNSFPELIEFCRTNRIDVCDDIIYGASLNDYIISVARGFDSWISVLEYLSGIPTGFEFYRIDGYGHPAEAESMFDIYKSDVLQVMDISQQWDGEDPEEDEEECEIEDNRFLSAVEG